MSEIFLELSDSMIRSDVLHQDAAIGQNLISATAKFINLAKTADNEAEDSPDTASEKVNTSSNLDWETAKSLPKSSSSTSSSLTYDHRPSSKTPVPEFLIPEDFNPVPDTLSRTEIFGNGWFGLQPELLSKISSPTSADMDRLDSSFGVKLIQTTLSIAYDYLIDDTGAHYETLKQMYSFAFIYHSREE